MKPLVPVFIAVTLAFTGCSQANPAPISAQQPSASPTTEQTANQTAETPVFTTAITPSLTPAPTPAATDMILDERKEEIQVFEDRIQNLLDKGILPIVDVEFHWSRNIPIAELVTKMDENGVALTWLGQPEDLGSKNSIKLHERYPDRIVPTTVHGSGTHLHGQDKSFLEQLITDVRSEKY